jgi:uncharacterized protein with ParB-like and HNH nuclease domain
MSNLSEKPIAELLGMNFFIPSYQRGYRWTEQQVEDLLEDINAFIPLPICNSNKKTWYCLQPIVVKECDEETKAKNQLQGIWYEVIDGQQRLTTIFLIIHYANEMWVGKQKNLEFQLKYETREESSEFLKNQIIDEIADKAFINFVNIDFHHITKAYNKIHSWVKNYKKKFNKDFDNNDFQSKFKSDSKVIWYEVDSKKDAIEIFTRINMGKISLTNAELIKALFLNSSNFQSSDKEEIRLRQLEIASEWDRMEYALQNDELWYFINNSENKLPTRIEYLFQIIEKMESVENINNSTFRFFSEKFKTKSKIEIDNNWKEIKRIFQTIEEWFSDRELYHKIGFLITTNTEMKDLLKEVKDKKKTDFKNYIDTEIQKKVNIDLVNLDYHKGPVFNVLLLHNIQTILNFKKETSRFPFNRFKTEKWDIEHIHAIATEVKVKNESQVEWLKLNFIKTEVHISEDFNNKIENILTNKTPIAEVEFTEIISYILGEEDNNIKNLCLLDRGTNRAYKNDSFKEKRRKIIKNEKDGVFIPICTKNVFMKYYSDELKDLELWNESDRESYFTDIQKIIFKTKKNN